jgi:diguanylate cyclase (GGDEF)-like protein/PAS domain S-box-containing protein
MLLPDQLKSVNRVGLAVCVVCCVLSALLLWKLDQSRVEAARTRAQVEAAEQANSVESALARSLSATYSLGALLSQGGGQIRDFDAIAAQLLPYYPGVQSLQIAPRGVVRQIYPLAGNEKAIGHDLLGDPARHRESALARDTGQLTLAGPFTLRQGGVGAAGRLPIYLPASPGEEPSFWGFAMVLMRFPDVLQAQGPDRLKARGYRYSLWRRQPDTQAVQLIAGEAMDSAVLEDAVEYPINTPNGQWIYSVLPEKGWRDPLQLGVLAGVALLASLLLGLLARQMALVHRYRGNLQALVDERTRELTREVAERKRAEQQAAELNHDFVAFLDNTSDFIYFKDMHSRLRFCSQTLARITGHAHWRDMLGKHDSEIFTTAIARVYQEEEIPIFRDGTPLLNRVDPYLDQHGNAGWVSTNKWPLKDAQGQVVGLFGISHDITQLRLADDKLRQAANVFTFAREGIMITDPQGVILDVNNAFTRITGYSHADIVGLTPRALSSGRQDKDFYKTLWDSLHDQGHWYGEIWNRRKNGEVYAEMLTVSAVRDAQGQPQQYVALFSDITTAKEHQSQLEHIAHFDSLTGLPNRVVLADRLSQAMAQVVRRGQLLAVVFLDLDGFKSVNDQHGHEAGDQLLIALADRMRQALREGDTFARIGGDEFVAVLLDLEDAQACVPTLNRLLAAAAQPVSSHGALLRVTSSLGVTLYPQPGVDADQLLRQADQAMYQAKLAGKNRFHIFDAEQDSQLRGHHEHLDRIRAALLDNELLLYYQPKVHMRSGALVGVEALIRWQHPQHGLLSPAEFLPEIEGHQLSLEVGDWVIETALAQLQTWSAEGLQTSVSVNVGALQLQHPDFVSKLRASLDAHPGLGQARLQLEILETSALQDVNHVSQVIDACRDIGVRCALDDFGTGYSSLTYLRRLPVSTLKIDQSFVINMLEGPQDMAILQGVIGLAKSFGRSVIAEGVETTAHGTQLLLLGCELAQGYGIARPMPAQRLSAWAASWQPPEEWSQATV